MKNSLENTNQKNKYPVLIFISILILVISTLSCSLPFKIVWKGDAEENEETAQANAAIAELLITKEPKTDEDFDNSGRR